jgi:hypothetical protein
MNNTKTMEIKITKEGFEQRLKNAENMIKQFSDELLMWEIVRDVCLQELAKFPKSDLPEGVKTIDEIR